MKRVLAIDLINRGFGFAVLDGPQFLIDWGIKSTSRGSEPRDRWCLRQVGGLIDFYQPDRIVLEECREARSRRGKRSAGLIEQIARLSSGRGIPVRRIAGRRLLRALGPSGTKYKIALAVVERFPELAWRLPPVRKPWMSEDARMGIFDAVALALAFYLHRAGLRRGAPRG